MNLVDKLLAIDTKSVMEKETATIEIKRLSKLTGEPFIVTVQAIPCSEYQDLQMEMIDRKGRVDYSKIFEINSKLVTKGVVEPDLKNENLQKHFGANTPKELAQILFQGADMVRISDLIAKVTGFGDEESDGEVEEEIKN